MAFFTPQSPSRRTNRKCRNHRCPGSGCRPQCSLPEQALLLLLSEFEGTRQIILLGENVGESGPDRCCVFVRPWEQNADGPGPREALR